jgi:signal transduction histidine kinase
LAYRDYNDVRMGGPVYQQINRGDEPVRTRQSVGPAPCAGRPGHNDSGYGDEPAELLLALDQMSASPGATVTALEQRNTELRRVMDQLVQSEKLAALGSMVAGLAHELNTPLGNAITVISTLQATVHELELAVQRGEVRRFSLHETLHNLVEERTD